MFIKQGLMLELSEIPLKTYKMPKTQSDFTDFEVNCCVVVAETDPKLYILIAQDLLYKFCFKLPWS